MVEFERQEHTRPTRSSSVQSQTQPPEPEPTPIADGKTLGRFRLFKDSSFLFRQRIRMCVSVFLYFVVCAAFYTGRNAKTCAGDWEPEDGFEICSWTLIDSLYFAAATMSTVGYGDLWPDTNGSRAFTVFAIFIGVLFVFAELAKSFAALTQPLTLAARRRLNRAFPPIRVDIDGNGETDFEVPRHPIVFYGKNLVPQLVLNVGLQLLSAMIFTLVEEHWSFGDGLYHCIVTATTVGYGDVVILDQEGARRRKPTQSSCLNLTR